MVSHMQELGKGKMILLFAMFVNSIADKINTLGMGIKIGTTSISILMYADDILSHLSPLLSNLIGLEAVNISRIVFQPCPHWSGLYGIISTM